MGLHDQPDQASGVSSGSQVVAGCKYCPWLHEPPFLLLMLGKKRYPSQLISSMNYLQKKRIQPLQTTQSLNLHYGIQISSVSVRILPIG